MNFHIYTVCVEQKLLGRRKGSIEYWFFLRQKGLFERAPESRTQFLNRDGSFRFEFLTNLPYHTNLISTLHNRDRHSDSTSNYCNYNQNQFYIPLRSATYSGRIVISDSHSNAFLTKTHAYFATQTINTVIFNCK